MSRQSTPPILRPERIRNSAPSPIRTRHTDLPRAPLQIRDRRSSSPGRRSSSRRRTHRAEYPHFVPYSSIPEFSPIPPLPVDYPLLSPPHFHSNDHFNDNPRTIRFRCPFCCRLISDPDFMINHLPRCLHMSGFRNNGEPRPRNRDGPFNGDEFNPQERGRPHTDVSCLDPDCGAVFQNSEAMIGHLKIVHIPRYNSIIVEFPTYSEFVTWKACLDASNCLISSAQDGIVVNRTNLYFYFVCREMVTQDRLSGRGPNEVTHRCPAKMFVCCKPTGVAVKYTPHYHTSKSEIFCNSNFVKQNCVDTVPLRLPEYITLHLQSKGSHYIYPPPNIFPCCRKESVIPEISDVLHCATHCPHKSATQHARHASVTNDVCVSRYLDDLIQRANNVRPNTKPTTNASDSSSKNVDDVDVDSVNGPSVNADLNVGARFKGKMTDNIFIQLDRLKTLVGNNAFSNDELEIIESSLQKLECIFADENAATTVSNEEGVFECDKSFTPPLLDAGEVNQTLGYVGRTPITMLHLKSVDINIPQRECELLKTVAEDFRKGWLYDSVIDAYLHLLNLAHCESNICLGTSISQVLCNSNERFKWSTDIYSYNTLFVPCNPSGEHWILLVIKFDDKRIVCYDPTSLREVTENDTTMGLIKSILQMLFVDLGGNHEWTVETPQHFIQTGGHDCGVYVCWYVETLLNEESVTARFDPNEYRERIYVNIVDNLGPNSDTQRTFLVENTSSEDS